MRRITNVEIAKYVFKKLEEDEKFAGKKSYIKILDAIDCSVSEGKEFELDDNGDIETEMTEEKIQEIKDSFLNGFKEEIECWED